LQPQHICYETVSFTDFDPCYRANYFEPILTTLEASFIF
jgi:hypothetical protein